MTDKKRISQGTLHCTNAEQPVHANTPPKDAMAKDTLYLLMFSLNARARTVCTDSNCKLANTAGVGLYYSTTPPVWQLHVHST